MLKFIASLSHHAEPIRITNFSFISGVQAVPWNACCSWCQELYEIWGLSQPIILIRIILLFTFKILNQNMLHINLIQLLLLLISDTKSSLVKMLNMHWLSPISIHFWPVIMNIPQREHFFPFSLLNLYLFAKIFFFKLF